jgi:hypothetical protein
VTEQQVVAIIKVFIGKAGSLRTLAKAWKVSPALLSDVINGRRGPGPAILKNLGLERRVTVSFEPIASAPADAPATPPHPVPSWWFDQPLHRPPDTWPDRS